VKKAFRPRRYEKCWEREEGLADEVKIAWEGHSKVRNLGEVAVNLNGFMDCLQDWSKKTIGVVSKRIEKLRKQLEFLNRNFSLHNQKEKIKS
jgi:hypothetical protein